LDKELHSFRLKGVLFTVSTQYHHLELVESMAGVSLVIITNMDGLPLYFSELTNLRLEVDPTLFSGFLAAMSSFSRAVRDDFQLLDLGLGELRLFFNHGEKVITIVGVLTEESSETPIDDKMIEDYRKRVALLGNYFHMTFSNEVDQWDGNQETFNSFKETQDLVLGAEGYSQEKHFEGLLGDLNKGRINKEYLVDKIWSVFQKYPRSARGN